jgi:antitoxin component YwqK of YwqJK toxin-antitoxin module
MKFHVAFVFILLSTISICQEDKSDYLDMYLDVTEKRDAIYQRVLTPLDEGIFGAEIVSLDGTVKAKGAYFLEDGELIPHGSFVFFHSNGKKESEGTYKMGYKVDAWKRYDSRGTEKTSKYYQSDLGNLIQSISE